jgi:hypothetical protein
MVSQGERAIVVDASERESSPSSPDDDALLRLVLYFDVFDHPARQDELEYLGGPTTQAALGRLHDAHKIARQGPWVTRPGRESLVGLRAPRSALAERQWPTAQRSAALLATLPFVEGLLVTGSLSKGVGAPDGDVDFLVLVAPGRTWTCRSIVQGLRRALPGPARRALCANYFLDLGAPELDDHDLFTAVELATAVPVHGPSACTSLLAANGWARRYVPGLEAATERATRAPTLARRGIAGSARRVSATLESFATDGVERRLADAWDAFVERKYAWLPGDARARRFKRRPGVATNHLHDFRGWVLQEAAARCAAAGIEPAP